MEVLTLTLSLHKKKKINEQRIKQIQEQNLKIKKQLSVVDPQGNMEYFLRGRIQGKFYQDEQGNTLHMAAELTKFVGHPLVSRVPVILHFDQHGNMDIMYTHREIPPLDAVTPRVFCGYEYRFEMTYKEVKIHSTKLFDYVREDEQTYLGSMEFGSYFDETVTVTGDFVKVKNMGILV